MDRMPTDVLVQLPSDTLSDQDLPAALVALAKP